MKWVVSISPLVQQYFLWYKIVTTYKAKKEDPIETDKSVYASVYVVNKVSIHYNLVQNLK